MDKLITVCSVDGHKYHLTETTLSQSGYFTAAISWQRNTQTEKAPIELPLECDNDSLRIIISLLRYGSMVLLSIKDDPLLQAKVLQDAQYLCLPKSLYEELINPPPRKTKEKSREQIREWISRQFENSYRCSECYDGKVTKSWKCLNALHVMDQVDLVRIPYHEQYYDAGFCPQCQACAFFVCVENPCMNCRIVEIRESSRKKK